MVITLTEWLVLIKMKNETVTLYSPGNKNPIVITAHLHSWETLHLSFSVIPALRHVQYLFVS